MGGPQNNRILIVLLIILGVVVYYQLYGGGSSVAHGAELYDRYCVKCHGVRGVGERPDDIYAQDEYGFVAPPMDDTGHAWHHTDDQLVNTILEGSPRTMPVTSLSISRASGAPISGRTARDLRI